MATIGFIGLGNMGAPMAANLIRAGHRVVGFDINAGAVQALASAGVQHAASAAEAARGAEIVITMLPAGQHVREVWLHQGGLSVLQLTIATWDVGLGCLFQTCWPLLK